VRTRLHRARHALRDCMAKLAETTAMRTIGIAELDQWARSAGKLDG